MTTKLQAGKFDCYNAALPDEPMFTLLGRDPEGPAIVREWAERRLKAIANHSRPPADALQVIEAYACAEEMRVWRVRHNGEWRQAPVGGFQVPVEHAAAFRRMLKEHTEGTLRVDAVERTVPKVFLKTRSEVLADNLAARKGKKGGRNTRKRPARVRK